MLKYQTKLTTFCPDCFGMNLGGPSSPQPDLDVFHEQASPPPPTSPKRPTSYQREKRDQSELENVKKLQGMYEILESLPKEQRSIAFNKLDPKEQRRMRLFMGENLSASEYESDGELNIIGYLILQWTF